MSDKVEDKERAFLDSLGYGEETTFDDLVFDDTGEFIDKIEARLNSVKAELGSFVGLDEVRQKELVDQGFDYKDLEEFAKGVGATRIGEGLIECYDKMLQLGSANSELLKEVKKLKQEIREKTRSSNREEGKPTGSGVEGGSRAVIGGSSDLKSLVSSKYQVKKPE
jgi:hypothetical protein